MHFFGGVEVGRNESLAAKRDDLLGHLRFQRHHGGWLLHAHHQQEPSSLPRWALVGAPPLLRLPAQVVVAGVRHRPRA